MAVTPAHLDVLARAARTQGHHKDEMPGAHRWGCWYRGTVASAPVRDCAARLWVTVEIHMDMGKHFVATTPAGLEALFQLHPCRAAAPRDRLLLASG